MLLLLFCNRKFHCFHIKIGLQSPHDFGSIKWRNASLFWHPVNRKAKGLSSTRVTILKRWKIASNVTFFQSWKRYILCCDTFIKSFFVELFSAVNLCITSTLGTPKHGRCWWVFAYHSSYESLPKNCELWFLLLWGCRKLRFDYTVLTHSHSHWNSYTAFYSMSYFSCVFQNTNGSCFLFRL